MASGAGNSRRFFTTTGPVKPDRHYCIPPLDRLDPEQVLALVGDEKYFVLHAPRQTGKKCHPARSVVAGSQKPRTKPMAMRAMSRCAAASGAMNTVSIPSNDGTARRR